MLEDCEFCKERETKVKNYEREIEREKVRDCQKALEREKIAKGMQCTREDEKRLRWMQKMQVEEKKFIDGADQEVERMWHQVLVEDVKRKEEKEKKDFERRQREMAERRREYDEQIASANRRRQEAIREERERENMRLERMKKKMEQDHYEALKKKKEQQLVNKMNFIDGHIEKLSRMQSEKKRDREIDNQIIKEALEELRKERQRDRDEMNRLQIEKKIFTAHFNKERRMATQLEEDADRMAQELKREEEDKADEFHRSVEAEKRLRKEKAAEEYRRHIEKRNRELQKEREDRTLRMDLVKRTAFKELQKRLDSANDEMRHQMEYRNALACQIKDNQKILETEMQDIEQKQLPLTKKPDMFRDAMEHKVDKSPGRISTNPVHPFRRVMDNQRATAVHLLPLIGRSVHDKK